MKKFLPILFFLATLGFADSKTDTTIVPKKAGGSVIISGGTGKVLIKGATVNVRDSEGAGTTTLTSTDSREQIFNLSAARTVLLPSTGIKTGEKWILKNVATTTTAILTIQSSGANTLGYNNSADATVECVSLQAAPTAVSHWQCLMNFSRRTYLCDKSGGTNDLAYNGGNKLTISSSTAISTVSRCVFIPYQMLDGGWRVILSISLNHTTGITVATIQSLNFPYPPPAAPEFFGVTSWGGGPATGQTNSSDKILVQWGSSYSAFGAYGDIAIPNKPVWAY